MSDKFQIYTDAALLPANEHEAYLEEGFGGVCTGGSALIEVFSVPCRISKNDIVTVLPLQLVSIRERSDDFSMTFFKVDKVAFLDIMSGLGKVTPDFFFFMRKNFRFRLSDTETERYMTFCKMLDFRGRNDDPVFRRETVLHLLRIYFWDFYVHFQMKADERNDSFASSSRERIAFRFAMLVSEHFEERRDVAFYADKLCISPTYLTKVIQKTNGQSASDLIADYVVMNVKALLRDVGLGIKDVARRSGFADQSSLSRFFRKHTGMSPTEYRSTIHITR